jgi:hypothetical protein
LDAVGRDVGMGKSVLYIHTQHTGAARAFVVAACVLPVVQERIVVHERIKVGTYSATFLMLRAMMMMMISS